MIQAQAPAVEPDAEMILKRMTDFLGGLQAFSLDTENMFDEVLIGGQKIQYSFGAHVAIQRPNRARAEQGTGPTRYGGLRPAPWPCSPGRPCGPGSWMRWWVAAPG